MSAIGMGSVVSIKYVSVAAMKPLGKKKKKKLLAKMWMRKELNACRQQPQTQNKD